MTSITIALNDERVTRLRQFADQRGQTVEQVIASLTGTLLPNLPESQPEVTSGTTLDLAGIIADPTVQPLTAREIDELLADAVRFQVMERRGILEALTTDEHFEQANKIRLLK